MKFQTLINSSNYSNLNLRKKYARSYLAHEKLFNKAVRNYDHLRGNIKSLKDYKKLDKHLISINYHLSILNDMDYSGRLVSKKLKKSKYDYESKYVNTIAKESDELRKKNLKIK